MNLASKVLILDVAHGIDTPGKRSPDGIHREYLWSRNRIAKIVDNVLSENNTIQLYFPFLYNEKEPGLSNRVIKYNEIAATHLNTLVVSLHNDAYTNYWSDPHGISVWTSKGQDSSDKYATDWFKFFKSKYPNDNFRSSYYQDSDPDKESDFTILAGNSKVKPIYDAFLIEWRFQTNKKDVKKLMNPVHNEYFEDMLTEWILTRFS